MIIETGGGGATFVTCKRCIVVRDVEVNLWMAKVGGYRADKVNDD